MLPIEALQKKRENREEKFIYDLQTQGTWGFVEGHYKTLLQNIKDLRQDYRKYMESALINVINSKQNDMFHELLEKLTPGVSLFIQTGMGVISVLMPVAGTTANVIFNAANAVVSASSSGLNIGGGFLNQFQKIGIELLEYRVLELELYLIDRIEKELRDLARRAQKKMFVGQEIKWSIRRYQKKLVNTVIKKRYILSDIGWRLNDTMIRRDMEKYLTEMHDLLKEIMICFHILYSFVPRQSYIAQLRVEILAKRYPDVRTLLSVLNVKKVVLRREARRVRVSLNPLIDYDMKRWKLGERIDLW